MAKRWLKGVRVSLLGLGGVVVLLISGLELRHHHRFGHLVPYGLHADVIAEDAHIGIPGQTKMYRALLTNFSPLPVSLEACDFVSDAMFEGTEYSYAVQRYVAENNSWETISLSNDCEPVPTSRIDAHVSAKRLWPGQTVDATGREATGAREPFNKGDLARFVLFRHATAEPDWNSAISSVPFQIQDQVLREGHSFRVTH